MSGNIDEIEWYLARDGQQFGPLSDIELKKVIDLGHLKSDDLLWRAGMEEWEEADNIFPQQAKSDEPASLDQEPVTAEEEEASAEVAPLEENAPAALAVEETVAVEEPAPEDKAHAPAKSVDNTQAQDANNAPMDDVVLADAPANEPAAPDALDKEATPQSPESEALDLEPKALEQAATAEPKQDSRDPDTEPTQVSELSGDEPAPEPAPAAKPAEQPSKSAQKQSDGDVIAQAAASAVAAAQVSMQQPRPAAKRSADTKTTPGKPAKTRDLDPASKPATANAAKKSQSASTDGHYRGHKRTAANTATPPTNNEPPRPAAQEQQQKQKQALSASTQQPPASRVKQGQRHSGNEPQSHVLPTAKQHPTPASSPGPAAGVAGNTNSAAPRQRAPGPNRPHTPHPNTDGQRSGGQHQMPRQQHAQPAGNGRQQQNLAPGPQLNAPSAHGQPVKTSPQAQPGQLAGGKHGSLGAVTPTPVLGSVLARQAAMAPAGSSQGSMPPGSGRQQRQALPPPGSSSGQNIINAKGSGPKGNGLVLALLFATGIGGGSWLAYAHPQWVFSNASATYSSAVQAGEFIKSTYINGTAGSASTKNSTANAAGKPMANSAANAGPALAKKVALKTPVIKPPVKIAPTKAVTSIVAPAAPAPTLVTTAPGEPSSTNALNSTDAAPVVAASAKSELGGNPLDSSSLWRYIEQKFPNWYAKRAKEATALRENNLDDHAVIRLMDQKMIALRRQHANAALSSSQIHLKAIAASFLTTIETLSKHSVPACYGFISHGESAPEVAMLFHDQAYSRHLDAQSLTILQAVVSGRQSPLTHKPPQPEDYRALAAELTSRGWTRKDLQLFTDPVALSNAKPAKVCSMVQDWFSAQLALPDSAAQLRLLVQSLRPVIAG